ncbi:unnamed protein product [Dovyalis caffra]|uniref:RING-type E3 ubiquitin transferase n=1 Tax=Dovyalis caffra TaxID=77055 RepID=A0AAV1QY20_9ROSI|nr:unnamed protein product [Dovyalis caffra]
MEDNNTHLFGLSPITIAVIGIVLASAGLLIYHFIVVLLHSRSRDQLARDQTLPQDSIASFQDLPSSFENSIASLIPACKYTNDIGTVSKSEDVTCAVCLSEFKDGEEVKVLPECLHTFHVSCIDMWLSSHSNCPICRTDMGVSTPAHQQSESDTFGIPDSGEPQRAI